MSPHSQRLLSTTFILLLSSLASAESDEVCTCPDCDNNDVADHVFDLQERVTCLESGMDQLRQSLDEPHYIRDCSEVSGEGDGGVYQIHPEGASQSFNVTCMFDDDGDWTVLQHRVNGDTDFFRSWAEYKKGFGRNGLNTNLWLGLDFMHQITTQRQYTLRVDLVDWDDATRYAEYSFFSIEDETNGYKLHVHGHSGTLVNHLAAGHNLNGMKFTTADKDHDNNAGNCALVYPSGWWHNNCYYVNLNGLYKLPPNNAADPKGIQWYQARGGWYSMKESLMRIKPTFTD